jgi:hypothetical protein
MLYRLLGLRRRAAPVVRKESDEQGANHYGYCTECGEPQYAELTPGPGYCGECGVALFMLQRTCPRHGRRSIASGYYTASGVAHEWWSHTMRP